jgi:DNA primase
MVAFPPSFLDEIRARVGLAAVVGRRVKLQKAGREWKGCCPFHNEKTPSFYVNEDKGFYHCFGCGVHGDVIRFVVEQEGLRFPEAVRSLAAEAGLDVPEETPEARQREAAKAGLHEIMAEAATWYRAHYAGVGGATARKYVEGRGLAAATVERFGIGFAPDGNKLRTALKTHGDDKLLECGLTGRAEDRDEVYDRFRNRLMFPIRDPRGRVVGFGGRVLGDGQPKYLNSPDTPLFDKGRLLYNLDRAGPLARKSGRLIVVEGYMDVIGLAQAGIEEAVAPLGTALTEQQLQLLWRVVPEPVLCFDGDAAGQRAALRAAARALPLLAPGRSLRFATLPPGQDPDDVARQGGAAAFEALLAAAEPLIERLWRSETDGIENATPERRALARSALREHARAIADPDVRALYDSEFAARFDAAFLARRPFVGRSPTPVRAKPSAALAASRTRGADERLLGAVLAGLLVHPELAHEHGEAVAAMPCADRRLTGLRAAILGALAHTPGLDKEGLSHDLAGKGLRELCDEVLTSNRLKYSFTRAETPAEAASLELAFAILGQAAHRLDEELRAATVRFRETGDEADYAHQQRLMAAQATMRRELVERAQERRAAADPAGG